MNKVTMRLSNFILRNPLKIKNVFTQSQTWVFKEILEKQKTKNLKWKQLKWPPSEGKLNEVYPQQFIVTTKKYEILIDVKIQKNSKASYVEETRENDHALQKFISVKYLSVEFIKKGFISLFLHKGERFGKLLVLYEFTWEMMEIIPSDVRIACLTLWMHSKYW